MKQKKRILIINPNQFGYDDYYYYVKYLSQKYFVDYWCFDHKKSIIAYPGYKIKFFDKPLNHIARLRLIVKLGYLLRQSSYQHILFRNFRYAFIIKLIGGKKAAFDIRTVSVSPKTINRFVYNKLIKFNAYFFERIFSISPEITNSLKIKAKKVTIIPLGANYLLERKINHIKTMKFLYVGTFDNRNIHETIRGMKIFCKKNPSENISYTIIGFGKNDEICKINNAIIDAPDNLNIVIKGYIPNHELDKYYMESNVGVSYVPLTKYYMPQPVTKTYEYLCAGMVVIATALPSNIDVINENNGVIITDNPESFANGVSKIYKNRDQYDLNQVSKNSSRFNWEEIIEKKLIKVLDSVRN